MKTVPFASEAAGSKYAIEGFPGDAVEATEPTVDANSGAIEGGQSTEAGTTTTDIADNTAGQAATEEVAANPLVDEAVEYYGFSREEAEQLGEGTLQAILAKMDSHALASMKSDRGQQAEPVHREQQVEPAAEKPADAPQLITVDELEELGLSADDYDENLIGAISKIRDAMNTKFVAKFKQQDEILRALAAEVFSTKDVAESANKEIETKRNSQFSEAMDGFFANLNPALQEVFGKVPLNRLREDSPLAQARLELAWKVRELEQFDISQGKTPRSTQHYAQAALRMLHGDKLTAAAKEEARSDINQTIKQRQKQAINAPSTRNNAGLNNRERAKNKIAEMLASMN